MYCFEKKCSQGLKIIHDFDFFSYFIKIYTVLENVYATKMYIRANKKSNKNDIENVEGKNTKRRIKQKVI
jgi:hypothetical protein